MTYDPTFYRGAAPHYRRGRPPYSAHLLDVFTRELGLDGHGTLLDVGCGPGVLAVELAPTVRVNAVASPWFEDDVRDGLCDSLAGIVVRISLVLIEFVHQALARGVPLEEALVQAGAIRMRPIFLTAGTTLLGNLVVTLDPIFAGLAWAVIFGVMASTAFTLGVVPVVYFLVYGRR